MLNPDFTHFALSVMSENGTLLIGPSVYIFFFLSPLLRNRTYRDRSTTPVPEDVREVTIEDLQRLRWGLTRAEILTAQTAGARGLVQVHSQLVRHFCQVFLHERNVISLSSNPEPIRNTSAKCHLDGLFAASTPQAVPYSIHSFPTNSNGATPPITGSKQLACFDSKRGIVECSKEQAISISVRAVACRRFGLPRQCGAATPINKLEPRLRELISHERYKEP